MGEASESCQTSPPDNRPLFQLVSLWNITNVQSEMSSRDHFCWLDNKHTGIRMWDTLHTSHSGLDREQS